MIFINHDSTLLQHPEPKKCKSSSLLFKKLMRTLFL
jgi:hypothetical protein